MVIYACEVLQWKRSKDQKVLTGRKMATLQAVMTTSQYAGVASSIWKKKGLRLCSSLVALQQLFGKRLSASLIQKTILTGPGKVATRGGEMLQWGGGEQHHSACNNVDIG